MSHPAAHSAGWLRIKTMRADGRTHPPAILPECDRVRIRASIGGMSLTTGRMLCKADSAPKHVLLPQAGPLAAFDLPLGGSVRSKAAPIGVARATGFPLDAADPAIGSLGPGLVRKLGATACPLRVQRVEAASALPLPLLPLPLPAVARSAGAAVLLAVHIVAGNVEHPLKAGLATWLLPTWDRVASAGTAPPRTQAFLAELPGTPRVTVNAAALARPADRMIRIGRGRVLPFDPAAPKQTAQGCHGTMRRHRSPSLPVMPEEMEG